MTPFILKGRRKLPPESAPSSEELYDEHRQLWIDKDSGEPLVSCLRTQAQSSQFGETQITETREGVDQSEIAAFRASHFGETTITKTTEGIDHSEIVALSASRFGETIVTATREGHDQREVTISPLPTQMELNREEEDSTDIVSASINAAYSHF